MSVRPQVTEFAEDMERKLKENDHKGGWEGCTDEYLMGRLFDEAFELTAALMDKAPTGLVVDEAADVANFAMMIADNAKRKDGPQG